MEIPFSVCTIVNAAAHSPIVPLHIHRGAATGNVDASRPGESVATRPQPLATKRKPLKGVLNNVK